MENPRFMEKEAFYENYLDQLKKHKGMIHGLEIYEDGQLVFSYGDTVDHRYPIYSATKSILSLAVGIAWDERKLDLKRPLWDYMPSWVQEKPDMYQKDLYANLTMERMLTMSVAGYPFRPEGENWLDTSLRLPLEGPEQVHFSYSNIPAYLVGVALSEALKEDLYEYMERKIFRPLDIQKPPVQRSPEGYVYGATGMELSVHELSKIGQVFYQNGVFNGERLVTEEYLKVAMQCHISNKGRSDTGNSDVGKRVSGKGRSEGYGYLIWTWEDGVSIHGKWKQRCYIAPKKQCMITFLADIKDDDFEQYP